MLGWDNKIVQASIIFAEALLFNSLNIADPRLLLVESQSKHERWDRIFKYVEKNRSASTKVVTIHACSESVYADYQYRTGSQLYQAIMKPDFRRMQRISSIKQMLARTN